MAARARLLLVALLAGAAMVACAGSTSVDSPTGGPDTGPGSVGGGATGPGTTDASGPHATNPAATGTGLSGVTVLDGCPMLRYPQCQPRPVPASFAVLAAPAGPRVATVTTGVDGRFRVPLRPGSYLLQPLRGGAVQGGGPVAVTVPANGYLELTVRFRPAAG
jgi:hypothetical protein